MFRHENHVEWYFYDLQLDCIKNDPYFIETEDQMNHYSLCPLKVDKTLYFLYNTMHLNYVGFTKQGFLEKMSKILKWNLIINEVELVQLVNSLDCLGDLFWDIDSVGLFLIASGLRVLRVAFFLI